MTKLKYFKEIQIIVVLVIILVVLALTNKYVSSYYHIGEGYEWDASASTSTDLPIMYAECDLHYLENYEKGCKRNIMLYGDESDNTVDWISCGSSGIGEERELYPNIVKILYYSFNENKFYGGTFKLDYNKVLAVAEKMRNAVLAQESSGITQSISFNTKVYPMGKVVVSMESYIKTSIGEVIIATFQAKPENHDWSVMGGNNSDNNSGISYNPSVAIQRELLLNKYNWNIEVLLPEQYDMKNLDVDVFGNKSLKMDTIKNAKVPTYGNFVYLPQSLYLNWKRKDTIEFYVGFDFDEQEIIKAFGSIDNKKTYLPIKMKFIVKDDTTALRAILNGNGKSIELKNIAHSEIRREKIYHQKKE